MGTTDGREAEEVEEMPEEDVEEEEEEEEEVEEGGGEGWCRAQCNGSAAAATFAGDGGDASLRESLRQRSPS